LLEALSIGSWRISDEETIKRLATGHEFSNSRNSETSTLGDGDLINSTPHASKDNKITIMIEIK
tara:strand:- start:888 stop:1079 length:192 start_codon:yes stop_codon:yes gene_type:complete